MDGWLVIFSLMHGRRLSNLPSYPVLFLVEEGCLLVLCSGTFMRLYIKKIQYGESLYRHPFLESGIKEINHSDKMHR